VLEDRRSYEMVRQPRAWGSGMLKMENSILFLEN
jgi:hypothetical protein